MILLMPIKISPMAQVIVQSTEKTGEVTLKANSPGLTQSVIKLNVGE